MAEKNALFEEFEDDIDMELEAGLDLGQSEPANDAAPEEASGLSPEELIFGGDTVEYEERPIPAISAMVFYETEETRRVMELTASDRRLGRAVFEIEEGGLAAAVARLKEASTPNLLVIESRAPATKLIAQIDELAEYCDEGVEVMVVGATNDIQLYRQLVARGVSEYLVPPVQPMQLIHSIASLFSDPAG